MPSTLTITDQVTEFCNSKISENEFLLVNDALYIARLSYLKDFIGVLQYLYDRGEGKFSLKEIIDKSISPNLVEVKNQYKFIDGLIGLVIKEFGTSP